MELTKEIEKKICDTIRSLNKLALNLTKDSHKAEDLLQDTVLRALTKTELFEGNDVDMSRWCYTIMKNVFINDYRLSKRKSATYTDDMTYFDQPNAYEAVDRINDQDILDQVDDELLIGLTEGYQYDELAEMRGKTLGGIKSKIHNARKHLVSELVASGVKLNELPARAENYFDKSIKVNKTRKEMNKAEMAANKAFLLEQVRIKQSHIDMLNYDITRLNSLLKLYGDSEDIDKAPIELKSTNKVDGRKIRKTEIGKKITGFIVPYMEKSDRPFLFTELFSDISGVMDITENQLRNWVHVNRSKSVFTPGVGEKMLAVMKKTEKSLHKSLKFYQLNSWATMENLQKHKLIKS